MWWWYHLLVAAAAAASAASASASTLPLPLPLPLLLLLLLLLHRFAGAASLLLKKLLPLALRLRMTPNPQVCIHSLRVSPVRSELRSVTRWSKSYATWFRCNCWMLKAGRCGANSCFRPSHGSSRIPQSHPVTRLWRGFANSGFEAYA